MATRKTTKAQEPETDVRYDAAKSLYEHAVWGVKEMRLAVQGELITKEQYEEITEKAY